MRICGDCPFKTSSQLRGSVEWLADVHQLSEKENFVHTCHKTDPKADGFRGGKVRECAGYLNMVMNNYDKTPGKGGVWKSVNDMVFAYLKHWQKSGILNDPRLEEII